MQLLITILLFASILIFGIYVGRKLERDLRQIDSIGSLVIFSDEDGSYMYLETDKAIDEVAKHSEVVLRVETQNPQAVL